MIATKLAKLRMLMVKDMINQTFSEKLQKSEKGIQIKNRTTSLREKLPLYTDLLQLLHFHFHHYKIKQIISLYLKKFY